MDARTDVEIQLEYLLKTNFENENQCIAVLEALKSINLSQCKKVQLLTTKQKKYSLGTSVIAFHGVEAWERLSELLHDIVDKIPNEINHNVIETIQLQDLYDLVRENGRKLHFCPQHTIRIQHVTLLRKLFKLEKQLERVTDLLCFDRVLLSEQLLSSINPGFLSKENLNLAVEFLTLLKELQDNHIDSEILYKQFNSSHSGWSFLEFICDSKNPVLAFHFINLGILNKPTSGLFKYMKEKILNYIKDCPQDVATNMLKIILDQKGPFYDLLRTKQGFFRPSPDHGTWKEFIDLYRELRDLPKSNKNDEELISLDHVGYAI